MPLAAAGCVVPLSLIHITKEKMELIQVPLPPLAEQRRIVVKINALMALCDQLQESLIKTAAIAAACSMPCWPKLAPAENWQLKAAE